MKKISFSEKVATVTFSKTTIRYPIQYLETAHGAIPLFPTP
ncbi:MAG: hypothetical protein AB8G22_10945 [Saprospiraceae bacterium]